MAKFKKLNEPVLHLFLDDVVAEVKGDSQSMLVERIVKKLNLEPLKKSYKDRGPNDYDMRMMLTLVLFSYLNNVYSCRDIEERAKYDLRYKYITRGATPHYSTINRFRTRLTDYIEGIFKDLCIYFHKNGLIKIQAIFIDGTTIESRSSRNRLVWRSSLEKRKADNEEALKSFKEDLNKICDQLHSTIKEELHIENAQELTKSQIDQLIENADIAELDRHSKSILKKVSERKEREENYQKQLDTMGPNRNSFSKTDVDAFGIHPKDDPRRTGPILSMHNVQGVSDNQFIVGYSINNTSDPTTFPKTVENIEKSYGKDENRIYTADAGYGTEENYSICDEQDLRSCLKYREYDKKKKKDDTPDFRTDSFEYDEKDDSLICPRGKKLLCYATETEKSTTGYEREIHRYRTTIADCRDCPFRLKCLTNKKEGKLMNYKEGQTSPKFRLQKRQAKKKLDSPLGQRLLRQRSIDIEGCFGQIKNNLRYRRFRFFEKAKNMMDLGLLFMSHNIRKAYKMSFSIA